MTLNNKEYQQWKKDKRRKRTLLAIFLTAIGIGGGIGIAYPIWNSVNSGNQPTPPAPPVVDVKSEDGHDWDHNTDADFSGKVLLGDWKTAEQVGGDYGTCSIRQSIFEDESEDDYKAEDLVIPEYVRRNSDNRIYRITEIWGYYDNENYYDGAFLENTNLTGNLTVPDTVTSIGAFAFAFCNNLGGMNIGKNVETIGTYAFAMCGFHEMLTIPDSVETIEKAAFSYCSNLVNLVISKNVITIKDSTFSHCGFTSLIIPNSVKTIETGAFSYCANLTSVDIPPSVISIGEHAFKDCEKLNGNLVISDSVTSIGWGAFEGCTDLDSLTIGKNVTQIDGYSFANCTSLSSVTIYYGAILNSGIPPTPGNDYYLFSECKDLTSIKLINFPILDSIDTIWREDAFKNIINQSEGMVSVDEESQLQPDDALSFLVSSGLENTSTPEHEGWIADNQ